MGRSWPAVDRWIASPAVSTADLGVYRWIYGPLAMLLAPRLQFLTEYPASLFNPPRRARSSCCTGCLHRLC